jgi:hypothetical protein
VNGVLKDKYFGNEDPEKGPLPVIINEALARRYFESTDPIGKTFDTPGDGKRAGHQIIGVVGSAVYSSLRDGQQPIF